jgi:hypothetical protein
MMDDHILARTQQRLPGERTPSCGTDADDEQGLIHPMTSPQSGQNMRPVIRPDYPDRRQRCRQYSTHATAHFPADAARVIGGRVHWRTARNEKSWSAGRGGQARADTEAGLDAASDSCLANRQSRERRVVAHRAAATDRPGVALWHELPCDSGADFGPQFPRVEPEGAAGVSSNRRLGWCDPAKVFERIRGAG